MKPLIPGLGALVFGLSLGTSAFAQSAPPAQPQPVQPQPAPTQVQSAPPVDAPVPPASQWTYTYPTGQWVYTADNGWVWVPAGAEAVVDEGVPYTYLYTPAFGWTWYVSPWGWGPYRYGGWVVHPWRPFGWRGGWVAHPRIVAHLGVWHAGWRGGGWHGGYHGGFHGGGFHGGGGHGHR
jgi:uncharacterized membrane protein YgcG